MSRCLKAGIMLGLLPLIAAPRFEKGTGYGWIWGKDDEVGALKAMTEASRLAALRLARTGRVYDLGVTYDRTSYKWPGHSPAEILTFRYRVTDGDAGSAEVVSTLRVTGISDGDPVAHPQSVTTPEDTELDITLTADGIGTLSLEYNIENPGQTTLSATHPLNPSPANRSIVPPGAVPPGAFEDVTGAYASWFAEHGCDAVLVRPDHIVFGASAARDAGAALLDDLGSQLGG